MASQVELGRADSGATVKLLFCSGLQFFRRNKAWSADFWIFVRIDFGSTRRGGERIAKVKWILRLPLQSSCDL